jgi:hypothetical protein
MAWRETDGLEVLPPVGSPNPPTEPTPSEAARLARLRNAGLAAVVALLVVIAALIAVNTVQTRQILQYNKHIGCLEISLFNQNGPTPPQQFQQTLRACHLPDAPPRAP